MQYLVKCNDVNRNLITNYLINKGFDWHYRLHRWIPNLNYKYLLCLRYNFLNYPTVIPVLSENPKKAFISANLYIELVENIVVLEKKLTEESKLKLDKIVLSLI